MSEKATTKAELLLKIRQNHRRLVRKFTQLTPEQMTWPGAMDDWSVKDILAHLGDWEQRFIGWYQAGKRGERPEMPAPGMAWGDLAQLNRQAYDLRKDEPLEDVLAQFDRSYKEILALVESMKEREIREPKVYLWTEEMPLLEWIAANTCEHYEWAIRNIIVKAIRQCCP